MGYAQAWAVVLVHVTAFNDTLYWRLLRMIIHAFHETELWGDTNQKFHFQIDITQRSNHPYCDQKVNQFWLAWLQRQLELN